ncbi:MAG: hypothetical protein ABW138_16520, partial [Candidatus Thiodiazotropha sp. 4PDIVS1]
FQHKNNCPHPFSEVEGNYFYAEKHQVHTVAPVCKTGSAVLMIAWNEYFRLDYVVTLSPLKSQSNWVMIV